MIDVEPLFKPFREKSLAVNNRIVMAPMTRYSAIGGVPTPLVADYYGRRADGGVGLIVSEGATISSLGAENAPTTPFFHGAALNEWRRILKRVHTSGTAMAPQLWHVGALRDPTAPDHTAAIVSPSGLLAADRSLGEPLRDHEIADTIAAFAEAAAAAKTIGFDAIELHGAHGYLIDQFFWSDTNHREDRYGGASITERARFAAEVVRAVRRAVGEDFAIILRISQWKQQDYSARVVTDPQSLEQWLAPLVDAGADIFHCSQRRFDQPEFDGSDLSFAGWVKQMSGRPTIVVGSIGLSNDLAASLVDGEAAQPAGLEEVIRRLERGEFDLVAVGRAIIADPEWPSHIRAGVPTRAFSADLLSRLH